LRWPFRHPSADVCKLFEHTPLGSGEPNRLSWTEAIEEDRQLYRDAVRNAQFPHQIYRELNDE
jgi:hypothetical protein